MRFLSATALGNIGAGAKVAKASLVATLNDSNQSVRDAAAAAVRSLDLETNSNK